MYCDLLTFSCHQDPVALHGAWVSGSRAVPGIGKQERSVKESRHRLQGGILYVNVKRATNLPRKPLYLGGSVPIVGSPHSKVKVRPSLGIVPASERGLKRYSCCVTLSTLPAPHRHT